MSGLLLKSTIRTLNKLHARNLHLTPVCANEAMQLTQEKRDKLFPKLGNRDIVGYGHNGDPDYMDRCDVPCPAVRWAPNTPEVISLRAKEKGDWKNLTLAEKKALYRASFRQTFAEMNAPSGEWKFHTAAVIWAVVASVLITVWMEIFSYAPLPLEVTDEERKKKMVQRMIKQGQQPVTGISSRYDFENNKWK